MLIWFRVSRLIISLSSIKIIKRAFELREYIFSGFSIIFFTNLLRLNSLFRSSEGELGSSSYGSNFLAPINSLIQHTIFLIVIILVVSHWQEITRVFVRSIFLWGLIILILCSFLWSPLPDITQRSSLALFQTYLFGVYFASRFTLEEQLRILFFSLSITGISSLLFSLAFPRNAIEAGVHAGAWRGPFEQKNLFARLMVLGSTVCLAITPKNNKERYIILGALALFIVSVILTASKTALGLVILLIVLKQFYKVCWWKGTKAIPFLLTLFLITACFILFIVGNYESLITSAGRDPTLSGRTIIWSALIDKIQERPWLGYGYMGFWSGLDGESAYIAKAYGTTYVPPHSHNGFFELILAFGLWGVLLFGFSLLSITRRAIISARLNQTSEGLWPLLYVSFILFYNQTESTLIEHNSIFWVIYVGLAFSRFISHNDTFNQLGNQKNQTLVHEFTELS
ncbi:O-antigen ligase family protein [Leptolyngbyaceae cyanobacterium CCMR0081]|uniref:O-antigen ligase family protein n=2 Tax=Adonisia TaxID=2950183 RepID=A0A6M0RET7_9CYAN|nr:O-antigen ligase family protein [Adonisia turfae CCMR0081]